MERFTNYKGAKCCNLRNLAHLPALGIEQRLREYRHRAAVWHLALIPNPDPDPNPDVPIFPAHFFRAIRSQGTRPQLTCGNILQLP